MNLLLKCNETISKIVDLPLDLDCSPDLGEAERGGGGGGLVAVQGAASVREDLGKKSRRCAVRR